MMIRTGRRRLPVLFGAIAALAVAGTVLGLLFSEVDAHTPNDGPHGSEHTHFYLWRTTMTVGVHEITIPGIQDGGIVISSGYEPEDRSIGSISTSAKIRVPAVEPAPQTSRRPRQLYYRGVSLGL